MRASHKHIDIETLIGICDTQGYLFEASRGFDLDGGASASSLFVTGDRPVILISRQISYNDIGVNAYSFRDPSITETGDPAPDVHSPNDFFTDRESTVKLYANPTITDQGEETRSYVELIGNESNQGKGAPIETISRPHRIPPNKTILHVIENRSPNQSQRVYARLIWIEPANIPELSLVDGTWTYKGVSL